VAVAEELHFGAAAARLAVSQPSLSAAVSGLEQHLGVRLLDRTTRRVRLTPEGRTLLRHAQAVVASVHGLVDAAAQMRALFGTLRLGMIPSVAPYVLPMVLRTLSDELPELLVRVREAHTLRLLDELSSGHLDLALLALPVLREEGANTAETAALRQIPLYREDFVLVVPAGHSAGERTQLTVDALEDEDLILLDEGRCLRAQTLETPRVLGAASGVDVARVSSLSTAVQLVAAGLGVSLVPDTAVETETRHAGVAVGRFATPVPGRTIGLVHRANSARRFDYDRLAEVLRWSSRVLPVRAVDEVTGP
jgi:LysR family hydrogen peroxide-inducible transcriptional activator